MAILVALNVAPGFLAGHCAIGCVADGAGENNLVRIVPAETLEIGQRRFEAARFAAPDHLRADEVGVANRRRGLAAEIVLGVTLARYRRPGSQPGEAEFGATEARP